MSITATISKTPVQDALDTFNAAFGFTLRAPILPEHVETAAELAQAKGREDIARDLRIALSLAITADTEVGA